jgi:hypothetical protein
VQAAQQQQQQGAAAGSGHPSGQGSGLPKDGAE